MSGHLPPLSALRAFEAVARLGSFTAAARELCLTQAAVSHQIKVLEDFLQCQVVFRSNRSVILTQRGERYVESVRTALDALTAATTELQRDEAGENLTVSVYPSFAAKWLVPRLGLFTKRHPTIRVRIEATPEIADFRRGTVDIGIRFGRGPWGDTQAERLLFEELVPVVAPGLFASMPIRSVDDLRQHVALHDIACDGSDDGWDRWLEAAGAPRVVFKGHLSFSDSFLLLDAALSGLGVAMGRGLLVADSIAAGRLIEPFKMRLCDDFAYWLVIPTGVALSRPAVAFREWILEEMTKMTDADRNRDDAKHEPAVDKVVPIDSAHRGRSAT